MSTSGGECSSCGILVRDETSQKWQCLRGYHGLRAIFPGRGLEQKDFWWCCQCLLRFRGARAETTPCKVCVLRLDTGAAKETAADTLSREERQALEAERVAKSELKAETTRILGKIETSLSGIKPSKVVDNVQTAINALRTIDSSLGLKEMETQISENEAKVNRIVPAKDPKTDTTKDGKAGDETAPDPNKKRYDLIQTWQAWINSQQIENKFKDRLLDGKQQYTLKIQKIESEIEEIEAKLGTDAAGSRSRDVRSSKGKKKKDAVEEEDMEEDEDDYDDESITDASASSENPPAVAPL